MSLLSDTVEEYKKNLQTASNKDREIVLQAIETAVSKCDTSCTIGKLENFKRTEVWLRSEGFDTEYVTDMRDGNYLIIRGWDK